MENHVCPWWMGYLLINPLRRIGQNPRKILSPYIENGMTVADIGSGMGYFSLTMAELVGENGKVICVDLQEKMIRALLKRAKKAGISQQVESRICKADSLEISDFKGKIDFILVFAILHEVPDAEGFLMQVAKSLKKNGTVLISEPGGHVTDKEFHASLSLAGEAGLSVVSEPKIRWSHSALLKKK